MFLEADKNFTLLINKKSQDRLRNDLMELYRHNQNLTYDYLKSENSRVVFITGKNEDEKSILPFIIPVVYTAVTGKKFIFIDIRTMVKHRLDGIDNLDDMIQNRVAFDSMLKYVKILMNKFDAEEILLDFKIKLIKIWSGSISSHITQNFRANQDDSMNFRILLAYYGACLVGIGDKEERLIFAAKCTLGVNKINDLERLIGDNDIENINVDGFMEFIDKILYGTRLSNITKDTFIITATTIVFGLDLRKLMTASLEDPALFVIILNNVLNNRIYNKTSLSNILKLQQKNFELSEFMKYLETM